MTRRGTWREPNGEPFPQKEAVPRWADAALPELQRIARSYNATISYSELAEHVQTATGIWTSSLLRGWIGKVLAAVARAQPEDEPTLTALVIDSQGHTGSGYKDPILRREGKLPDDLEWHAAVERLRCYEHFGAELPPQGGTPTLTAQETRRRFGSKGQKKVREICPEHHLVLPASGICDLC